MKIIKTFPNQFKIKNKFLLFIGILILTILITRILTLINDPNVFIRGFELHHFYYGIILLIITSIAILFGKLHPRLYTALSAISIGLILDELFFVMAKVRGPIIYEKTLASSGVLVLIIGILIGLILFDIIGKLKHKK
tara:strand:- start:1506 stop:1919 length:414 start_codon:yes stop_codon:yes gene_type:complete